MKLIQTPSLITGVILGASLITLSAAGSDAGPEDLKVFVPGTTVSSADVNANFTYLDDEVTAISNLVSYNTNNIASNSSRIDTLENGSGSGNKFFLMDVVPNDINTWSTIIEVPLGSNPIIVNSIRIPGGHQNWHTSYAAIERVDGSIITWAQNDDLLYAAIDHHGVFKVEGWRGEVLVNPGEKLLMKARTTGFTWSEMTYYLSGEYVN